MILLVRKYETNYGHEAEETFTLPDKESARKFKENHYSNGLGWRVYEAKEIEL